MRCVVIAFWYVLDVRCCAVHDDLRRGMGAELSRKRALLAPKIEELGIKVLPGHGAYFLVGDVSKFLREGEDDQAFCKRLTVEGGVTLIPISGFYVGPNPPKHLVRFAYCKDDSKLHAAIDRLQKYLKH